jgi:hypothetical protein
LWRQNITKFGYRRFSSQAYDHSYYKISFNSHTLRCGRLSLGSWPLSGFVFHGLKSRTQSTLSW